MKLVSEHIQDCDKYLKSRTGCYEFRSIRYKMAINALQCMGLNHDSTIMDIGAGWTEFDYCLRTYARLRSRYIPVDGGIDGTDLEVWSPKRKVNYFVSLELIEHLNNPKRLIRVMQNNVISGGGIVLSTPNPETTDVLAMDHTHKTPITKRQLEKWGFTVEEVSLYGKEKDSLFAFQRIMC